jgi:hypothetical protein
LTWWCIPIEHPIAIVSVPDNALRRRVDEQLRDILDDDRWDFGVDLIEVTGSSRERARRDALRVFSQRWQEAGARLVRGEQPPDLRIGPHVTLVQTLVACSQSARP